METGSKAEIVDSHPENSPAASLQLAPWQWWRQQMPVTQEWVYFDHAAVGPLSGPAASAARHLIHQSVSGGDVAWPQWAANMEVLRRSAAKWLGTSPSEVALIPNTTSGINLVAEGWPWQPGDSVVIPEGEFPSNLFPWLNQQSRGVEVRIVPRRQGRVEVADLIARVDDSTRMIAASWVGYASGYRLDVSSLVEQAHARGVLVFLDAIQGLGVFPLDLAEVPVDFLAADGHKWMLGPEGIGVAVVRQPHQDRIRCGNVGWASVKNSFDYADPKLTLRDTAARFESGSANMMGVAALAASFGLFEQVRQHHGAAAIGDRVLDLTRQLDRQLRGAGAATRLPSDPDRQSGILTFEVPGVSPAAFRKAALAEKIVLSCRDGGVRASVHAYNDAGDLDRLVSVVRSFAATAR